ncbi:MAG: hypothetical protein ACQET8_22580 [Bacillota bacterium]
MEIEVRKKLIQVLEQNGIKLNFVAKQLNWNYRNLVSFKNNKLNYSEYRLIELKNYLSKY